MLNLGGTSSAGAQARLGWFGIWCSVVLSTVDSAGPFMDHLW
jgi:hypothetical protein